MNIARQARVGGNWRRRQLLRIHPLHQPLCRRYAFLYYIYIYIYIDITTLDLTWAQQKKNATTNVTQIIKHKTPKNLTTFSTGNPWLNPLEHSNTDRSESVYRTNICTTKWRKYFTISNADMAGEACTSAWFCNAILDIIILTIHMSIIYKQLINSLTKHR